MKLFDINGQQTTVDVKATSYPIKGVHKSKIQERIADVLVKIFPREVILEDFIIPSSKKSVDFFIPRKEIVIEVQGKQHNEFVPYFHGNKLTSNKYVKQQLIDAEKEYWAELNHFTFIPIDHKEIDKLSEKELYDRISIVIKSNLRY